MAEVFRAYGARLGLFLGVLVALWATVLVIAPSAGLAERSLTGVEPAALETRLTAERLRADLAGARRDWDATGDVTGRTELDRRIRMLVDRLQRLEPTDGTPRRVWSLDGWRALAGSDGLALLAGLARALGATGLALVLAWPIARIAAEAGRRGRISLVLAALLLPFGLGEALAQAAWTAFAGPHGAVAGLIGGLAPLDPDGRLATGFAVAGGHLPRLLYAHVLFAVVPLWLAFARLDPGPIAAARDLGATWPRILRRIVLPEMRSAIAVAATLVFALAAGAAIAPLVARPTGGDGIDPASLATAAIDPSRATAAGLATAAVVVLVAAAMLHLVRRSPTEPRAAGRPPVETAGSAGLVRTLFVGGVLALTLLPLLTLSAAAFGFSSDGFAGAGEGFRHNGFSRLLADPDLRRGLAVALGGAALVTALALPLGLAGGLFLDRLGGRAGDVLFLLLIGPILVPGSVVALANLVLWQDLHADGGRVAALATETSRGAAIVLGLVRLRLADLDRGLVEAARDLGAAPELVTRRLLAPHLAPTVALTAVIVGLHALTAPAVLALAFAGEPGRGAAIVARLDGATAPESGAVALILLAATLLAVIVAARTMRHSGPSAPAETGDRRSAA